ncbi:MAG: hypothetical protein K8R77_07430, partial [Anaerolineaceae bacterium]|nr:hypothetical protein [Anaerolineaceae bacterium]
SIVIDSKKSQRKKRKIVYGGIFTILLIASVIYFPRVIKPLAHLNTQVFPVYFSAEEKGNINIYRYAQGSYERMTFQQMDYDPVSMGMNMFFTSIREGKREIYMLDPTGEAIRMTYSASLFESWDSEPTLSGWLYFTSDRSGKAEIYRLNFSTSEVQQLTFSPGDAESWEPEVALAACRREHFFYKSTPLLPAFRLKKGINAPLLFKKQPEIGWQDFSPTNC